VKKLVVSIVTWNSAETISACISSVLSQSFSEFDLIIVDNNSKDETCNLIEKFSDARIKLHKKSENTGFCGGHNFSIHHSESEFVLLVNPDIVLSPNYIDKAVHAIQKDVSIGTICGLLLLSDPADPASRIDSAGLEIKKSRIMRMRYNGERQGDCDLNEQEVFGADGALPLYRRAMIDDISINGQFFDEMFFAHKEDWDVSWRASLFGWKTIFDPTCVAIHPRHFKPKSLKVRTRIAGGIKIHSVKNQLILLLKNEKMSSFIRDSIFIVPRQFMIFFYILLFERSSLQAYSFVWRNYKEIMLKRKIIQQRRVH
jgi:GT2 family glycosyltransferase